jgi:hypothetical protein
MLAPASPTGFAGQVRFEPTPGCWAFFATAGASLEVSTLSGEHRSWAQAAPVSACRELAVAYTIAVDHGQSVVLTLRSANERAIGLVVERIRAAVGPADTGALPPADGGPTDDAASVADATGEAALVDTDTSTDIHSPGQLDGRGTEAADTGGPALDVGAPSCRNSGPCTRDDECCEYCHDGDHCH